LTVLAGARPRLSHIRVSGWTCAVAGLGLAFVALHLWLSRDMDAPFIFSDEIGYLLDARYLSGVDPAPEHPFVPFYSVGYPLLLAPLSWIFDHPTGVYHGALLGNALLGGVTIPILYAVAREVLGLVPKHALLAAGLAGAYPAFLLHTNIAWAENLLPPLVALHVLFVYRAVRRGSLVWLAAPAVTAAALYATHPRTLPIVGVTVALLGWIGLRRLAPRAHAAAALGVMAVLGLCGKLLNDQVEAAVYRGPIGGGRPSGRARAHTGDYVVDSAQDPSTYGSALVRAFGQAWYLCATSAGLWALGVGFLAYMVWRRRGVRAVDADGRARAYTAGFMLLAVLASFPPSVLIIVNTPSNTHFTFYGRYLETISPVVLLAGAAAVLLLQGRRQRLLAVGAAAGVTLLLTLILNADSPALEKAPINPVVVLAALFPGGVSSWEDLIGFDLLRATALGLAGMALFAVVPARRAGLAVVAVGVGFVVSALVVADRVIEPFAENLSSQGTIQSAVDSVPPGEPISYELKFFIDNRLPRYQFAIDDRKFLLYDSRDGERPTSDVVISSPSDGLLRKERARIAAVETALDQAVWIRPGPLQRRLEREGRIFPGKLRDPLPAAARHSLIAPADPGTSRLRVPSGRPLALDLLVTHTGKGSPWGQSGFALPPEEDGAVFVIGSWHRGNEKSDRISSQAAALPRTLAPGATLQLELTLKAVDLAGKPLRPGDYTVDVTPAQKGVGFFSDRGGDAPPLELPVEVTDG